MLLFRNHYPHQRAVRAEHAAQDRALSERFAEAKREQGEPAAVGAPAAPPRNRREMHKRVRAQREADAAAYQKRFELAHEDEQRILSRPISEPPPAASSTERVTKAKRK